MTTATPDLATLLAQLAEALAEQQCQPPTPEPPQGYAKIADCVEPITLGSRPRNAHTG
jgi:hypothetical protein